MSGGNTITGQRATMRRSAKVGGVEVHDLSIVWIMHQVQIDALPCREHGINQSLYPVSRAFIVRPY